MLFVLLSSQGLVLLFRQSVLARFKSLHALHFVGKAIWSAGYLLIYKWSLIFSPRLLMHGSIF